MFAPNTDLFLPTGILAENTQGHTDIPSRSALSLLVPSTLCFGSQRTFHGLTPLAQQPLGCILLYSLQRACTALVSSRPHDSFTMSEKPPFIPTSQVSRMLGSDRTLPRLALLFP